MKRYAKRKKRLQKRVTNSHSFFNYIDCILLLNDECGRPIYFKKRVDKDIILCYTIIVERR